ncbi:hypothetical protein [Kitasatospora sp. LaBMicrA B282]|uniref:hypothetical protein n=1 Tax=Kitasatospora sp. LaBMicrA B282 TaxID=3420949 RepID=UPI003D14F278
MADISLNHTPIDNAKDELIQASNAMHAAMEECIQAVQACQQVLEGDLATAAGNFFTQLANADGQMTDDINQAASTLGDMHELLRRADATAAAQTS